MSKIICPTGYFERPDAVANKRYMEKILKEHEEFPDRTSEGLDDMKRRFQRNETMFNPEDIYFYAKLASQSGQLCLA